MTWLEDGEVAVIVQRDVVVLVWSDTRAWLLGTGNENRIKRALLFSACNLPATTDAKLQQMWKQDGCYEGGKVVLMVHGRPPVQEDRPPTICLPAVISMTDSTALRSNSC